MSSEQKFNLSMVAILAAAFVAFAYSFVFYYSGKNARIAEMLSAGVNPVAISCALDDELGKNPTCVILAAK